MPKTVDNARSFFKKSVQSDSEFKEGFESKSLINTPSIAIPITIDLTEKEKLFIQKILVEDYMPGSIPESLVPQHVEQLTNISKQIKSISAQSVLLHGERIKQAQDLLANYREGAFTKWLMSTYGNRQTPYSMLRYYEFYQNAPAGSRTLIESAPKKCIYMLASRDGDEAKKLELIKNHGQGSQSDFVLAIQGTFPTAETNKRKPLMAATIKSMGKLCHKLEIRSKYLTQDDRMDIEKLIQRLQKL